MAYRFKPIQFHARRRINEETAKTDYVCYVCGRDIDGSKPHWMIHAVHGGSDVIHPADEEAYMVTNDRGDLGGQPVGPTCVKKYGLTGWATLVPPNAPGPAGVIP